MNKKAQIKTFKCAILLSSLFALLTSAPGCLSGYPQKDGRRSPFWAAITVSDPLLSVKDKNSLTISFDLVNDSWRKKSPQGRFSQLLVNGEVFRRETLMMSFAGKPGDDPMKRGEYSSFTFLLGPTFKEPGTYEVQWIGREFESNEVRFRILPADGSITEPTRSQIWSAIAISDSLIPLRAKDSLKVSFALVNDKDEEISPDVSQFSLLVNGEPFEPEKMAVTFKESFGETPMKPGDSARFDFQIGPLLTEPGIYEVQWKGPGFESNKLVFRIVPRMQHGYVF